MKLGVKLSILFIVVILISAFIITGVFYVQSTKAISLRVENQLESINILKKDQLENFIEDEKSGLELLAFQLTKNFPEIDQGYRLDKKHMLIHNEIKEHLEKLIKLDKSFIEIFVLDLNGNVHFSSSFSEEGKIKQDKEYFIKGLNSSYVSSFDYNPSLQVPNLIISIPLKNKNGKVISVLAARVNISEISALITEKEGLGKTGESYLVNSFNLLLTDLKFDKNAVFRKKVFSKGVKDCLNFKEGFAEYEDYKGIEVFGYHSWIPDKKACLLTEIEKSEALEELFKLRIIMLIILIFMILFTIFMSLELSQKITFPLRKLKDAAFDMSQGRFRTRLNIHSKDEIEKLAITFITMAKNLKNSRRQLQDYNKSLEKKVKQRTKQLESKAKEAEDSKKAILNIMGDVEETNKKLKETEKLLRKNLRQMKLLDKQKNQFISITSHELKTPITSIKGFTQLLTDPKIAKKSRKRKKYLDIVNREVSRLSTLISDILDLSRLDLQTVKFNYEPINLKEILDTVKKEHEHEANQKKIKLKVELGGNIPKIENDRTRLLQIFTNLVVNAIHYTEKGYVKITANKKRNKIHFIVEDTGIGISKKNFSKIFERFYQVDSGLTRKIGGTGLGLAITKELVDKMNGKIWLESKVGKGTKFHILLPIKQTTVQKIKTKNKKTKEEIKNKKKT